MSSSQNFPSYEVLRAPRQAPRNSTDLLRLRWKSFGPLATSIRVAANAGDQPSAHDQTYDQGATGHHPILASSLTQPPISSIRVTQVHLDDWEQEWVDEHLPHADYDGAVWTGGGEGVTVTGLDETATEDQEDADQGDDETGRRLMRRCDEDRPPARGPGLVVRASSKPYVTIHDYVTAVHAWLQTHRDDILRARGVHESGPVPADTVLYVNILQIDVVRLDGGHGKSDFRSVFQQAAHVAGSSGGEGGGFPTAAFIAASRRPLDLQGLTQNPGPECMFIPPKMPPIFQNSGSAAPPAVPGEPMHRMQE